MPLSSCGKNQQHDSRIARNKNPTPRSSARRSDRVKAVDIAVGQIEKQFGKGSIMRLGQEGWRHRHACASRPGPSASTTRSVSAACHAGRVVEIYGPEASGKTTLALQVIAQAQRTGGNAAFVDAEHALDPTYARKLGVDLGQPARVSAGPRRAGARDRRSAGPQSGGIDVVVVDSVAALVPRAEIEGEMGDAQVGLQARLMSQALSKLTGVVAQIERTCLIFINQLREKIGVMFGNPETTTGGRALKFYSSIRIDIRRIGAIKDADRSSEDGPGSRSSRTSSRRRSARPSSM